MKIILIVCFALLSAGSGLAQRKEFPWLVGTWKVKDKNEFERWTTHGEENSLTGKVFQVRGADTLITEVISLTFYEGAFHYVPDVAGPQEGVDFTITKYDDSSFVAENPKHDFPKIIRYKWIQGQKAKAIEAAIEGNGKVIAYRFEKLK
jgi:hypothetical protein